MRLLILILIILTTTACAVSEHAYSADGSCLTCVRNPITGNPLNYTDAEAPNREPMNTQRVYKEPRNDAGSVGFEVPYDVEQAYYAIQREFSFPLSPIDSRYNNYSQYRTMLDPELSKRASRRNFDVEGEFRYSQGFREHGNLHLVIGVKIVKIDHRTSKVTVSYLSEDTRQNIWDVTRSLRERVLSTLEYYSCDNVNRDFDNQYRYSDPCYNRG